MPPIRFQVAPARGEAFEHRLEGDELVVGRSTAADLKLADRFLSRRHARLFRRGAELLVEDLGSSNGTFVNGRRIEEPTPLVPGDVVQLSACSLELLESPAAPPPPGAEDEPTDAAGLPSGLFRPVSELLETGSSPSGRQSSAAELRRDAERLGILNEVHRALARSLALPELLELILDRVFRHLRPEEGAIFLEDDDGEFVRAHSRSVPGLGDEYLYSRSLVREVAVKGQAALVLDTRTDERFGQAASILASGVRSLVAAPLFDAEGCLGMIALVSRLNVRQFTEEDLALLASLASAAALRIRNLALAEEAAERRRLGAELELARRIQVRLLPQRLPELPGWEIFGICVPSEGVSGDFYEVIERGSGEECLLVLADVAGKGIGAALLTACLEALAAGLVREELPPDQLCERLSPLLYERTPPERFATALVAALEPATGVLRYANAGHNPPLVVRAAGAIEELPATGLPLGLLEEASYRPAEVHLAPGDLLVAYTDGITEATDEAGREYGLERLREACHRHRSDGPASALAAAIEADLERFTDGTTYPDDRTLLLVRRSG